MALVAKILENIELLKQIKHLESDMLVQKLASELDIPIYFDYELDYKGYDEIPKLVIDTSYREDLAHLHLPNVVVTFPSDIDKAVKSRGEIAEIIERIVENIELLKRGMIAELEEKVKIPMLPIVADFSYIMERLNESGIVLLYERTRWAIAYLWVRSSSTSKEYVSIEFREPKP